MKAILLIALLGGSATLNAGEFHSNSSLELAIAINNNSVQVGTDKSTTSFPNAGMNTTPTKMIGTDNHVVNPNNPTTKPETAPGGVWPTAPAYTPPPSPGTSNTSH